MLPPAPSTALAGGGLALLGLAADATQGGGVDLQGIALVITAVSGLIATVGALVIGLRKKPPDPLQVAMAEALLKQARQMKEGDDT